MAGKNEKLFRLLDILMSEYGQPLEYWMKMPGDVVAGLVKAAQRRQGKHAKAWTMLIGAACAAGFSGKLEKLENLFSDKSEEEETVDAAAWKGQVKSMWMKMQTKGKKNLSAEEYKKLNAEFEEKWASGQSIEF